jgi:SAM-dependent methyltransferase
MPRATLSKPSTPEGARPRDARPSAHEALVASLYAAVHRGTPGDLAFHAAACEGGHRVLELGCGHGRVARALAARGHTVVGVDSDPALLALARRMRASTDVRGRIDLREGDIRALARHPVERFDRVVVAYSTLYCLGDDDEVRSMLQGARAHLVPGGRLVLDAYAADPFHETFDPAYDDPWGEVARVRASGRRWSVLEQSDWDRDAQRVTVSYRHEPLDGGPAVETRIVHRYVLKDQLARLLEACGFRTLSCAGGFDGRPYDQDAEQLVVVAEA